MTSEEYKALSVKEFTEAAKIYDSGHSGVYEMCKDDYPFLLEELEKSPSIPYWTAAAVPVRRLNYCTKNIPKSISPVWI